MVLHVTHLSTSALDSATRISSMAGDESVTVVQSIDLSGGRYPVEVCEVIILKSVKSANTYN